MGFSIIKNIKSKKAEQDGINNFPGVDVNIDPTLTYDFIVNNLTILHQKCINPLLEEFGKNNIGISSAYRCTELNKAIRGVKNSQHIKGYAIDIISIIHPTSLIFNWFVENIPEFNQVIWEYPEKGQFNNPNNFNSSWIHISYKQGDNPGIRTISTKREDIHQYYHQNQDLQLPNKTYIRNGDYTHNIVKAEEELINTI